MITPERELIQNKLRKINTLAPCLQSLGLAYLIFLLYFKPNGYQQIGQHFALLALLTSFIISKLHTRTGKQLEHYVTFNQEEIKHIKREYLIKFFLPYILWLICFFFFASISKS